ncbi:PREDICTED: spore wall protein 2-like [Dinoponera quadriceps]|uniref:Spore wall protein 2-like n=1 Tax=Dinoponera quadriceps TaxID=609295 RepID=A0A6P3XSI0_DINQU|nr:PREDICTED: spore wall protein 2-like [Dinoponera quadriceps]
MHSGFPLVSLLSYLLVCNTSAGPVVYENVAEDDVVAVGSYIREVRQPAPLKVAAEVEDLMSAGNAPESRDNKKRMKNVSGKSDEGGYYRTYGSDAEGEKGYLKETYGKGDQGYKTLDTFHKQDGDKYEFETQTAYGKDLADDNKKKKHEEKKARDHESAGTMVDTEYAGDEGDHGSEYSHYTGSDDGDHYSSHYTEKEPESTGYGHNENYSSGGGDEESYETHGSYHSDDKGEEEDDGDHY